MKYPTSKYFLRGKPHGSSPLRLFPNEDLQNTLNKMKEGDEKNNAGEAAEVSLKDAHGAEKTEQQAPQGGDITLGLKYRNTKSSVAAALLEDVTDGPEEQRDQYRALQTIFIGWPKRLQDM
jgi:hypothetical protein